MIDIAETLRSLVAEHALALLFLNVLLEQAGLPIPACPTLVMARTLTVVRGDIPVALVFTLAVLACVVADTAWFFAGRRHGTWLMRGVCRVSLSPDSCIRKSTHFYRQIGPRVLLVAKFLPGAGALTTLMAGTAGTSLTRFVLFDAAGSAIWVASALMMGILFEDAVGALLALLAAYVVPGFIAILACFAAFLAWKWARRMQVLRRSHRVPRLRVQELKAMQSQGVPHVVVDVRPDLTGSEASIPGAIRLGLDAGPRELAALPADASVIVYCDCPSEVSAAYLAERIRAAGRPQVYALLGGISAWADDAPGDAVAQPARAA